jgi:hypothetical protein
VLRLLRVALGARRDAGVPTKAKVHAMLREKACECGSRDSVCRASIETRKDSSPSVQRL